MAFLLVEVEDRLLDFVVPLEPVVAWVVAWVAAWVKLAVAWVVASGPSVVVAGSSSVAS